MAPGGMYGYEEQIAGRLAVLHNRTCCVRAYLYIHQLATALWQLCFAGLQASLQQTAII
jgi:hypothetical protein